TLPLNLGWHVTDAGVHQTLTALAPLSKVSLTHEDIVRMLGATPTPNLARDDAAYSPTTSPQRKSGSIVRGAARSSSDAGRAVEGPRAIPALLRGGNIGPSLQRVLDPPQTAFDRSPGVIYGAECDPENMPDQLPEGAVCQRTGEYV